MAQYAVPDSDVSAGSWEYTTAGSGPLYTQVDNGINGGTPSSSDGIRYDGSGPTTTCELGLENLTDPGVNTDHIIRVYANNVGLSSPQTLTVAIFDGATQVDTTDFNVTGPGSPVTYSYTLDSTNVENDLNDYTDLRVKLTSSTVDVQVYEVELEIPDGGGGGGSAVSDFIRFENGCMSDFRGMVNIRG